MWDHNNERVAARHDGVDGLPLIRSPDLIDMKHFALDALDLCVPRELARPVQFRCKEVCQYRQIGGKRGQKARFLFAATPWAISS